MNLRDLSHILGLSQTTVSRALNGYPEVSEATRQRVQDAARRHNYHPNTRAKGLATGRAMAIAHVIPVCSKHEMVNPVFADFIAGAGERYACSGYDMMLSLARDENEAGLYRNLSARRSVDGIIVHAPRLNDPRMTLLRETGLPFVVHGRFPGADFPYNWLDMNNHRAFEHATTFLLDLGHRRIALINGLESMDFAARRRAGFLAALGAHGQTAEPAHMWSDEMTEFYGYDATHAMMRASTPPTAILTSSLIIAMGVRRACGELGLTLGRDLSLITHDDDLSYFRNGADAPEFTVLHSPVREHGRLCADMLLRVIDDPTCAPLHTLLDAELRIGRSTGPAPRPLRIATRG